jgi:hypothetical protein
MPKAKFTAFPVPVHAEDIPLVTPAGADYRCSGCGGVVPAGAWLFETIRDGMVVGLTARMPGSTASPHVVASTVDHADGEIVHQCGERDG